jgi:hypothetical protein
VTVLEQRIQPRPVIRPTVLTHCQPLAHNLANSIQAAVKPNTRIIS